MTPLAPSVIITEHFFMLRNKPTFTYCGLTVILSNPSRFDNANLLSATGGRLFAKHIAPEFNRYQCDIRVREDKSPLIPGTKCILLLGADAAKDWLGEQMRDNTLNEVRGSVFYYDGIPTICSYFPQDAADIKDYESSQNKDYVTDSEDDDDDEYDDKSRHNKTKRKNFSFWLWRDILRCKHIMKHGVPTKDWTPDYVLYPSFDLVLDKLYNTSSGNFFIDLETDYDQGLQCFSFSFGYKQPIYCVPFLDHNYHLYYGSKTALLLKGISMASHNNTIVAHNGSGFDFIVLCNRYHIPLGPNMFDTMIAMHRCFPEVEKSLGHGTSIWTWESFHKDEGNTGYLLPELVTKKLRYCGKDVYTMILIYEAIQNYAKTIPGLKESIQQAMESLRPYLITTLLGIKYDQKIVEETFAENDALMMQYARIAKLLIGAKYYDFIQGKSKKPLLNSNTQCVKYFHDLLGYPIVGRGKEKKDGTRGPSLAKKNMYKLKLKHTNPVIDLCLAYRETAKESGSLKFTPIKSSNDTTTNNV